jgi:hypothetical protein
MLDVTIGSPQQHKALTIFPLVVPEPVELPYVLLVDALNAQALRITEVGSGTVPELYAVNEAESAILILDGEQLIGARQNRMTNRSIVLPGKCKTRIPVSCMEQGRWHFDSEHFTPSPQHSPSAVRRQAREVEAEYAARDEPVPREALARAQSKVWESIADHADAVGCFSETGAMNEMYQLHAADLDTWVGSFPGVQRQVGLLAFLGGRPLGMDVIGGCGLYARLHDRLLRGYIMDALGRRGADAEVNAEKAQSYLDGVRSAQRTPSATVGQGRYSVLSGEVIGGELTDEEHVAHLSAFPTNAAGAGPGEQTHPARARARPLPPPSRRRRPRGE